MRLIGLLAVAATALGPAGAVAQEEPEDDDPGRVARAPGSVPEPSAHATPAPTSPAASEAVFRPAPPATSPPAPPMAAPRPAPVSGSAAAVSPAPDEVPRNLPAVTSRVTPAAPSAQVFSAPVTPSIPSPSAEADGNGLETTTEAAESSADDRPAPRVKLAFRRFEFVRVGGAGSGIGRGAASETFHNLTFDVYPVSRLVRSGFSTQLGWESGEMGGKDMLLAESVTLGVQRKGRVTPFVEGFAGLGYLRRVQLGTVLPTAYWQVGVDAGAEVYVRGRAYLSLAVGYLRPVNAFARMGGADTGLVSSVFLDTWSLKVGVGI